MVAAAVVTAALLGCGVPWPGSSASSSVGTVTNYPGLSPNGSIAKGPDGAVWFTNGPDSIGRTDTSGRTSFFYDPGIDAPVSIVAGSDGNMWFTNLSSPNDGPGSIG